MNALNAAETSLPGPQAALLRGNAASALLGRTGLNALNAAEMAVVANMHTAGEDVLIAAVNRCRTVPNIDVIRRATTAEIRAMSTLSLAEQNALIAAKQSRLLEKARVLKDAHTAGTWRSASLGRDLEALCHSGVTGRGGTNAAAGLAEAAEGAGWGTRVLVALGVAVQVGVTVLDIADAEESAKICRQNEQALRKDLARWASEDPRFRCTNEREGRYEFRESTGSERVLFTISLRDFATRARAQAADARVAADIAGLTATGILLAARASSPIGWVVAGIEVSVRVGIDAWEYSTYYDIVRRCPLPVLVRLGGTSLLTGGRDEADLLEARLSRIFVSPELALRQRLMFTFAMRHIAMTRPNDYRQITAGLNNPQDVDELFDDFKDNIIPYFTAVGFATMRAGNLSWNTWKNLQCNETIFQTEVGREQLMQAFNATSSHWAGHREERRRILWRREAAAIDTELAGPRVAQERRVTLERRRLELRQALYQQGFTVVFGRPLRENDADLDANNTDLRVAPRTRHALSGLRFNARLTSVPGNTWPDKLLASHNAATRPPYLPAFTDQGTIGQDGVFRPSDVEAFFSTNRQFVADTSGIHGLPSRMSVRGLEHEHVFNVIPQASAVIPQADLADPALPALRNRQTVLRAEIGRLDGRATAIVRAREQLNKDARAEAARETPDFTALNERQGILNMDIALYFHDLQMWEAEGIAIRDEVQRLRAATATALTQTQGVTQRFYNNEGLRTELARRVPGQAWLRSGAVMASGDFENDRDGPVLQRILETASDLRDVGGIHIRRAPHPTVAGRVVYHVVFVCSPNIADINPDANRSTLVHQGFELDTAANTLVPGLRVTHRLPANPTLSRPGELPAIDWASFVHVNGHANHARAEADYTEVATRFEGLNPRQRLDRAMGSENQFRELWREPDGTPVYGVPVSGGRLMLMRTRTNNISYQLVPAATIATWRRGPATAFRFPAVETTWQSVSEDFCRRLSLHLTPGTDEALKKANPLTDDDRVLARALTLPNDVIGHTMEQSAVYRILYLTRYGRHTYETLGRQLWIFSQSLRQDLPSEYRAQIQQYNRNIGMDIQLEGDVVAQQAFLSALLTRAFSLPDRDTASTANCETLLRGLRGMAATGAFGDPDRARGIPDSYMERDPSPRRWNPDDIRRPADFSMAREGITDPQMRVIERLNGRSQLQLRSRQMAAGTVFCLEVGGLDPSLFQAMRTHVLARCAAGRLGGYPVASGPPNIDYWYDPIRQSWIFQAQLQRPAAAQMGAWIDRYREAFFTGDEGNETAVRLEESANGFKTRALWSFVSAMRPHGLFRDVDAHERMSVLGANPTAIAREIAVRLRAAPTTGFHCDRAGDLRLGTQVIARGFVAALESDPWAALASVVMTQNHSVQNHALIGRLRGTLTDLHALAAPSGVTLPAWNDTIVFLGDQTHVIGRETADGHVWDTEPMTSGAPRLAATPRPFVYHGERCEFEMPSAYHVQRSFQRGGRTVTENDYHGAQSFPWDRGTGEARFWREIAGEDVAEGQVPNRPPDCILRITHRQEAEAVNAFPAAPADGDDPTERQVTFRGQSVLVRLPAAYYVRRTVTDGDRTRVTGSYGSPGRTFQWSETADEGYADIWPLPPGGRVPTGTAPLRLRFTREGGGS